MSIKEAIKKQLDLPVSFSKNGSMVTLEDYISQTDNYLSTAKLNEKQQAEIALERIRLKPEVKIGSIGAGILDKESAIKEIQAQTPTGKALVEIERRVIDKTIKLIKESKEKDQFA